MKKKIFTFFMFLFIFISMPLNVKGADYKICLYRKEGALAGGYNGALHVVGSTVRFDMYSDSVFGNSILGSVVNGDSVDWPSGVNSTHGAPMDPKFLLVRCPKMLCESEGKAWVDEKDCSWGTAEYVFITEVTELDLNGLDMVLAYKYNGSDAGKVSYSTILDGGCPSNEGIFVLLKSGYGILRIAAPVILVLFASIDLGKAVVASDEGQIKKAQSHLMKRVAAAVVVFLVFVIIELFVSMISSSSDVISCINQFLN